MALKIISKLETDIKPVINSLKVEKQLQANQILLKDYIGELSSFKGVNSKGLFIIKIDQFTTNTEFPNTNIISNEYFHTDKSKVIQGKGVYGETWTKTRNLICNEDEQQESN